MVMDRMKPMNGTFRLKGRSVALRSTILSERYRPSTDSFLADVMRAKVVTMITTYRIIVIESCPNCNR